MHHKVLLLGDAGSGKTDFIRPFVRETFEDAYINTVGSKVSKREVTRLWPSTRGTILATSVWFLWDIAGQRTFEKVIRAYTRASVGALVVVNATSVDPAASARRWLAVARESSAQGPVMVFMIDPANTAQTRAVEHVAQEGGAHFTIASRGTPAATETALLMFGEELVERYLASHPGWPSESQAPEKPGRRAKKKR